MREVVLRVPRAAVEDVLDRLLLIVPRGVRESQRGRQVELKLRGNDLPSLEELKRAVGRWPHRAFEREISDDWHDRRVADYSPEVIGGRLVVRPEWAPAAAEPRSRRKPIEIVLRDSPAFGGGGHATTRTCLELLLDLVPCGTFADLGCGSGVLAILAARLGWEPVLAVDIQLAAVEAARENAERNGTAIDVRAADLMSEAPPPTAGFAANFPATLHTVVAAAWKDESPRVGVLSGFIVAEARSVVDAYAAQGLHQRERFDTHGWSVLLVERS